MRPVIPSLRSGGLCLGLRFFLYAGCSCKCPTAASATAGKMHPDVGVSAGKRRWSGPWELSGSAHWHQADVTRWEWNRRRRRPFRGIQSLWGVIVTRAALKKNTIWYFNTKKINLKLLRLYIKLKAYYTSINKDIVLNYFYP